jgi:hypothetical protein
MSPETRYGTDQPCESWTRFFKLQLSWPKQKFTCRQYGQLGMVLITPVKYGQSPTSSLTCESLTRFFYLQLWLLFCAAKLSVPATCTTKYCTDHYCEISRNPPSSSTCESWTRFFKFLALVAILCSKE